MKTITMLELASGQCVGPVIHYKDFVIAVDWSIVKVYRPIETEEETGESFENLRLEIVTEFDGQRFGTEGEALRAGMDFIDWKF